MRGVLSHFFLHLIPSQGCIKLPIKLPFGGIESNCWGKNQMGKKGKGKGRGKEGKEMEEGKEKERQGEEEGKGKREGKR